MTGRSRRTRDLVTVNEWRHVSGSWSTPSHSRSNLNGFHFVENSGHIWRCVEPHCYKSFGTTHCKNNRVIRRWDGRGWSTGGRLCNQWGVHRYIERAFFSVAAIHAVVVDNKIKTQRPSACQQTVPLSALLTKPKILGGNQSGRYSLEWLSHGCSPRKLELKRFQRWVESALQAGCGQFDTVRQLTSPFVNESHSQGTEIEAISRRD